MNEKIDNAMKAYRLGIEVNELIHKRPRVARSRIAAHIKKAAALGIQIAPDAFDDFPSQPVAKRKRNRN